MPLLTFIPILLALDFSLSDQDRKIKVRQRFCVYHIFLFSHYQRTTISGEMVFQNQIAVIIHLYFACLTKSRRPVELLKGGDPAAGSPTATLLRLHPNHRYHRRRIPPLRVRLTTSGRTNFRGVTGGVYKARERIHRSMLICDY